MFDTHCHLTFPEYRGRVADVLRDARAHGVHGAITVSTTAANAAQSLELARAHRDLWCTAGVHPLHSDDPLDWPCIRACGRDPKCVAWGELGLDNHYANPPRELQRRVLDEQLAHIESWRRDGLEKPIVIHCRDAFDDLLPILRATTLPRERFVFHCFTGTPDEARAVLDFGASISFTGVVTFRNAKAVADAACLVPGDRIMVETDAPFLTPEPFRTTRPNEPKYVTHVADRLADLRGESRAAFADRVDANAERFFGLSIRRTDD
ncbi:MAG: TatD family hydrolase [Phycisphaerae bacterium]|nr:TatD family hydrolase [Phycisphaerae bacterium]